MIFKTKIVLGYLQIKFEFLFEKNLSVKSDDSNGDNFIIQLLSDAFADAIDIIWKYCWTYCVLKAQPTKDWTKKHLQIHVRL